MIRSIEPSDLDQILALYKELRPNDPLLEKRHAENTLKDIIDNPNTIILVTDIDGKLCSTCMLGIIPGLAMGARSFAIIEHVVTLQEERGKGYGKALLSQALDLAWEKGCYKIVLLSGEQRMEAHRVYESVGFVSGVEKGFVAKPNNIKKL